MESDGQIKYIRLNRTQIEQLWRCIESQFDASEGRISNEFAVNATLDEGFPESSYFNAILMLGAEYFRPLRSILRIVIRRFDATDALLEIPYVDMEFWDSHRNAYEPSWHPISRECRRIHFFKKGQNATQDLEICLIEGADSESLQRKFNWQYLGFSVLRPTIHYAIGRTALLFDRIPRSNKDAVPSELNFDQWVEFYGIPHAHLSKTLEANILNSRLQVASVPFAQQDPMVGNCATTSIWVAAHMLDATFGLRRQIFGDIQDTAVLERPISSKHVNSTPFCLTTTDNEGLSARQICKALAETGATVFRFNIGIEGTSERIMQAKELIYSLSESGLPVILCTGGEKAGHAVTIVGHLEADITDNRVWENTDLRPLKDLNVQKSASLYTDNHYSMGQMTTRYIVHNDAYGPYDRLAFNGRNGELVSGRPNEVPMNLDAFMVAMPPYVRNLPTYVAHNAARRISFHFEEAYRNRYAEKFRIIHRVLLVKGSDFKRSLRKRGFSPELQRQYSSMHLPQFVWLCEFSVIIKGETLSLDRSICGEMLVDATSPIFQFDALAFRWKDFFVINPLSVDFDEVLKLRESIPLVDSKQTPFSYCKARGLI